MKSSPSQQKVSRKEGRRVRSLNPMATLSPYIMKTRNTSSNFISDRVEVSRMEKYIHQKREEGLASFGILHVLLASYVRCISQLPGINRFIRGQKIYARNNIEIMMTIKKKMAVNIPDTVIKMVFPPDVTASEVYELVNEAIENNRKSDDLDSDFDLTARAIDCIPSLLKKNFVFLLTVLDYFGLLPRSLVRVSPFHGSMFITSMGSLGIPPIYHHLYDFGNCPVFLSFGITKRCNELLKDGNVVTRRYLDYTFVTDERICDGFYYATTLKMLRSLLIHPSELDQKPETIVQDIP